MNIYERTGILDRLDTACHTCHILWDRNDPEDTQRASVSHVTTLLLKKGVSFYWLYNGRGLFWDRDTVEHTCQSVSADILRYEYGLKATAL